MKKNLHASTAQPDELLNEHDREREALEQIQHALRGLRYGQVTIIVQDGVIVQIDRVERKRLT